MFSSSSSDSDQTTTASQTTSNSDRGSNSNALNVSGLVMDDGAKLEINNTTLDAAVAKNSVNKAAKVANTAIKSNTSLAKTSIKSGNKLANRLTDRALDFGELALASNTSLARDAMANSNAYADSMTKVVKSTVDANNALSTGSLTSLRDALAATLDAPEMGGDAADSGGVMSWARGNPVLAAGLGVSALALAAYYIRRR